MPLTVLGAVVVLGTLVFSFLGLRALEAEIDVKTAQREALDLRIAELEQEIDRLQHAPLSELVKPDALAVKLDGKTDPRGRQLYEFSYWLDVPNNRKGEIRVVEYHRRFGESLRDVLVGREPSNGFAVSYLGWGCFPTVDVTIVETTGQKETIQFDQCEITRWGSDD